MDKNIVRVDGCILVGIGARVGTWLDCRLDQIMLHHRTAFIFDWTVLHLVTIAKWSTIWSNMKGPHIFNCPLHMQTSTIVVQILKCASGKSFSAVAPC